MHFLMTALGSYGDVYPVVGLGAALRGRGHQVSIVTNPNFQSVVESAELEFLSLGTIQEYEQLTDSPNIWHPFHGPKLVMKLGMVDLLRRLYQVIDANCRVGETVLVASAIDLASRVVQEKHSVPLASLFLAPMPFRSSHLPPKMGPLLMDGWVPDWFRRWQFWLADRLVVDRIICPELNRLRRELGLPPASGILRDWYFSPQLVLGLFPEWFAPPQPDWPQPTYATGFPLWDEAEAAGLPADVAEFLAGGESPIVFTPGSAMAHGKAFFRAAVEACDILERRALLLTKYPDQLPANLPSSVRHFPFVPFSQLLPRAAAVVHHGGIGSCAQGLASGLPQLVMPMAFDQFDNADRIKRLGVASIVRRKHFGGPTVARALDTLLRNPATHENCHHWAKQCDSQAALAKTCELLEALPSRDR